VCVRVMRKERRDSSEKREGEEGQNKRVAKRERKPKRIEKRQHNRGAFKSSRGFKESLREREKKAQRFECKRVRQRERERVPCEEHEDDRSLIPQQ
jgi:hypothetical protein